jgi:predicted lipoprotein with Yx(FWY)xxD motif
VANNLGLGAILVNAQGRTLYYFVPERGGRIVCTGQCTGAWPPLFTASMAPTAGATLPGRLGIVARASSDQVTYNNWPLYTFAGDARPDQTNGQGVFGFGGKWFVATPRLQA